ncbi:molybdenum cofactor biosynthesis protein MoaE [Aliikangiella sp. IMCC44653]
MNKKLSNILISEAPLDLAELNQSVQQQNGQSGASVIFTGAVRSSQQEQGLTGMTLEHYPGMTESQLERILSDAKQRWHINDCIVAHRVGYLTPGEVIVFVGVAGLHRKECFAAAQFIMDYLKQKATFWKKEHYPSGSVWVEAKQSDAAAFNQWNK